MCVGALLFDVSLNIDLNFHCHWYLAQGHLSTAVKVFWYLSCFQYTFRFALDGVLKTLFFSAQIKIPLAPLIKGMSWNKFYFIFTSSY